MILADVLAQVPQSQLAGQSSLRTIGGMKGSEFTGISAVDSVSIIVPFYNEAKDLQVVIQSVFRQRILGVETFEIILVDDGSTDGSTDIAWQLVRENPDRVRLVCHGTNKGKGAAIRSGLTEANGAIVIVQDADLEYSPAVYSRLLEPLLSGACDAAFGSRLRTLRKATRFTFWQLLANRLLTKISNILTGLSLTDVETGSKAFRRSLLDKIALREDRFGFEVEVTTKLAQLGARISEVDIEYQARGYRDGKKVGWIDGVRAVWCLMKYTNLLHSLKRHFNGPERAEGLDART